MERKNNIGRRNRSGQMKLSQAKYKVEEERTVHSGSGKNEDRRGKIKGTVMCTLIENETYTNR